MAESIPGDPGKGSFRDRFFVAAAHVPETVAG
jgi:hypothetical protein